MDAESLKWSWNNWAWIIVIWSNCVHFCHPKRKKITYHKHEINNIQNLFTIHILQFLKSYILWIYTVLCVYLDESTICLRIQTRNECDIWKVTHVTTFLTRGFVECVSLSFWQVVLTIIKVHFTAVGYLHYCFDFLWCNSWNINGNL